LQLEKDTKIVIYCKKIILRKLIDQANKFHYTINTDNSDHSKMIKVNRDVTSNLIYIYHKGVVFK